LRIHRAELDAAGNFARRDELVDTSHEPNHQELCNREQEYFLRAIREDLDLAPHLEDAVRSLQIVLAADRSVRSGRPVEL
jgi:predicted dehydrogenase